MQKVVITEFQFNDTVQERRVLEPMGIQVVYGDCKTEQDVINACRDADAVLYLMGPMNRAVIQHLKKCKILVGYGAGYDPEVVKAATERGIPVANTPGYCREEVSDHAIAMMYALARKLFQVRAACADEQHEWGAQRPFQPIRRMLGQTVGVVGIGHIGSRTAQKAKALGYRVLATDPYVPESKFKQLGAEKASLEELLARSDYVTLHTLLSDETRHMIGAKQLAMMKKSAYLINTCRGPVIDQAALIEALEKGTIAGAGLDVQEKEPPPLDVRRRLLKLPNVIMTSHTAWYSEESMADRQRMAAETAAIALKGGQPDSVVNKQVYQKKMEA